MFLVMEISLVILQNSSLPPGLVGTGWSYWFNWCAYIPSEAVAGGIIMHVFFD